MKTAIVTGASGNLGQAVAKKLLEQGYQVTGTLNPKEGVAIDSKGKNFETAAVDLLQEDATRQFVDLFIVKHQKIDIAILTVGAFAMGSIAETSTADIAKQYRTNFETAYNIARPVFIQMMRQGSGRIFLIGSRAGIDMHNSKGMVAYGLGKSLVFRLAELMNDEAKGTAVVTSVVVPSTIDTPQNRSAMPDANHSRWVTPEAIANVIAFHCSEEGAVLREPVIKVYGDA